MKEQKLNFIDEEIERIKNKFGKKQIRQDKYDFTIRRLACLKKLCLLNNVETTVENGLSLLLSGADLKEAMKNEKASVVSQNSDYFNLDLNTGYYVKRYNYNNDQKNIFRALQFCGTRLFKVSEYFYFPKILKFDPSQVKMEIENKEKYPNGLESSFFDTMGIKIKQQQKSDEETEK